MGLADKAMEFAEQAKDKAKGLTEQAALKLNELGADDLIADAIVRAADKRVRVNAILEAKGCAWRIDGIEVANSIPPTAVFSLKEVGNSQNEQ